MSTLDFNDAGTYPVNLAVAGRPVLVVGAGAVAARKAAGLLSAGATVTMVSPEITLSALLLAEDPALGSKSLTIHRRPYRPGEAADYRLVITATNDPLVNKQVFNDCEAAAVWCNSADDLENCSFILPAIVRQEPMSVAVSSNGVSPALSSWLKRRIADVIPSGLGQLADVVAEVRSRIRDRYNTTEAVDWATALDANSRQLLELANSGRKDEAVSLLLAALEPLSAADDLDWTTDRSASREEILL